MLSPIRSGSGCSTLQPNKVIDNKMKTEIFLVNVDIVFLIVDFKDGTIIKKTIRWRDDLEQEF